MTRSDGDRMDRAMDLMLDWFDRAASSDRAPSGVETARAIIAAARKVGVNPHELNRVSQNFLTEVLSPPEDRIRHALQFLD
ncbi:MAG: hypothetical protein AAGB01_08615 [Cyanobacteria bacterium P01_F01_bin.42]